MTNISLKEPPLLAVIPADDAIAACVVRVGLYDDDKEPADLAAGMSAGYEALAACRSEGLQGADQILVPVRDAIMRTLKAQNDDVLLDIDVAMKRGSGARFNVGFISSSVTAKARAYFLVKDEIHTEVAGPVAVHKGESVRITFASSLQRGGRVTLFARGADVDSTAFGELTTDMPFVGKVLDDALVGILARGFDVVGRGDAKVVAFYTPP